MKTGFMLAVFCGAVLLSAEENYFPNPGFESWNDAGNTPSAPAWRWRAETVKDKIGDPAFKALERSTRFRHSGKASLHICDENSSAINNTYVYSMYNDDLKPFRGKTVRFSCWIRQIRANSGKRVGIGVGSDGGGRYRSANTFVKSAGETDFQKYTVYLDIAPDAKSLLLFFFCARNFGCTAEAYFDDAELTIADPAEKKAAESKTETGLKLRPGSDFLLPFFPAPRLWSIHGESPFVRTGNEALKFRCTGKDLHGSAGIVFQTGYLDRMLSIHSCPAGKLQFQVDADQKLPVSLRYRDAAAPQIRSLLPAGEAPVSGGFRYTFTFPESPAKLDFLKLEFPDTFRKDFEIANPGFITGEKTAKVVLADAPEAKAYSAEYTRPVVFTRDRWTRPVIENGNFKRGGKYEFLLGPWVYNHSSPDFKTAIANRLNIQHPAYQEPPGKKVFDFMGFNAAQMSAAPGLPGAVLFGVGLPKSYRSFEKQFAEMAKDYDGTYMVMDFAFSFDQRLMQDQPQKWKELEQKIEGWHAFVPVCPEHPEGDKFYRDLMTAGTKIVLKNGFNVGVWELFNESSYGCQCVFNKAEFARRMEKRYGTIRKANAAWHTDFSGFDELAKQPRFHIYKGLWGEWAEFLGDRYAEVLKKYAALVRSIDKRPHVYFTEQLAGDKVWDGFMDYRKIADALDLLAYEGGLHYGHSRSTLHPGNEMEAVVFNGSSHWYFLDFFAALGRGKKPILNNEHYCWRSEYNLRVPSKRTDMITSLWNELFHGSAGNFTYSWDKRAWEWSNMAEAKQNVVQPSYKSSSLLNPYNWPPEELSGFRTFTEELAPYQDKLLPFPRTKAPAVGIYHSYATARMGRLADLQLREKMQRWYSAALHANYPVTFCFDNDLTKGLPRKIQALLIPCADYESPAILQALAAFVKRGGILIADTNAFRFDTHGNALKTALPPMTRFAAGEEKSAAQVRNALAKHKVRRYALLTAADKAGVLSGTDVQLIDRGDFKMLFAVGMFDIIHRKVKLQLFLEDKGGFYLADAVKKRLILPPKGELWDAALLARGLPMVLPPQERVLLTLTRTKPAGLAPYRAADCEKEFQLLREKDQAIIEEYNRRTAGQSEKRKEGRIMRGVKVLKCVPLDLSHHVNMDFSDELGGDRKGGAFDQGQKDFSRIPRGKITAAGVPFTILDPAKNNRKALIVLAGRDRNYFPAKVTGIPVNAEVRALYFLHTIGWGHQKGETVMHYLVRYADGGSAEIPVRTGLEIAPWMGGSDPAVPENAKIGLEFRNVEGEVNLQAFRWLNPEPGRRISTIDIVSTIGGGVPAIAAITMEKK